MDDLINVYNEQWNIYNNRYEITINDIKKILKANPSLIRINNEIKKLPLFTFNLIKHVDYVIDGLNVEGGFINNFRQIRKILDEPRNNFHNKKILIIIRMTTTRQKKADDVSCKKLIKEYNNVKIIYVHTTYMIGKKIVKLIESCKWNKYCTPQEVASGLSIKGEKLCVTPIITAPNKIQNIRPMHSICEIDDLLVFYVASKYDAIIISNTEDYTQTIDEKKIKSIKYFLNIPITYYYAIKKKNFRKKFYIAPFKLLSSFLKLSTKKLSATHSIMLKSKIII